MVEGVDIKGLLIIAQNGGAMSSSSPYLSSARVRQHDCRMVDPE
jgi:hypothetical protein